MEFSADDATAYQTIRVTAPESPVAALADVEAWKARKAYPSMFFAGGPVFGIARERPAGGWVLQPYFSGLTPQDARDGLGSYFRRVAMEIGDSGDPRQAAEYEAAGELLDWEALNDLTVCGCRYRLVRAERFIRMGPDGPEPPRVTDPDPSEPGESHYGHDPAAGLVIDPYDATGVSDGILKAELLAALRKHGTVPSAVRDDSRTAAFVYPGGVLLPAAFMTAEREGGQWRPGSSATATTPQSARDGLAMQLRVMVPWQRDLTAEQRAVYNDAADRLDAERCDELDVAGRHFRIVRVERLVRLGPDGPEGPRPSDPDPVPPVMVQDRQLRAQGVLRDEEDSSAEEPDESTQKFLRLFDEERRRRESLRHP
ncbi:DUF5954 family protein [Actinacidiphila paucisporea]|uniref:PE-PGRS family protein n=1 Tax=Actinacidiphila paucisporea TaxID=310782 RepID=A0A1M7A8P1_9ACTN|nr:DUF5954 family protein [Actinacidiphila paucisporea]SHL39015.1 hypothetical protein SAMN05216499_10416 [Actinacidiphila paucisporea]